MLVEFNCWQKGDPFATAKEKKYSLIYSLLEEYRDKWNEKHQKESPEDLRWATLSTRQQLEESPLIHESVKRMSEEDLVSYAAVRNSYFYSPSWPQLLDKNQVEEWPGWIVEHNVPQKPFPGPYKISHNASFYKDSFVGRGTLIGFVASSDGKIMIILSGH